MVSLLVKLWIVIMSAVKSAKLKPVLAGGSFMEFFEPVDFSQIQAQVDKGRHVLSWRCPRRRLIHADTFIVFNDLSNIAFVIEEVKLYYKDLLHQEL